MLPYSSYGEEEWGRLISSRPKFLENKTQTRRAIVPEVGVVIYCWKKWRQRFLHRKARPIENLPGLWIHRELNHLPSIFFSAEDKIPLNLYSPRCKYPAQDNVGSVNRILMPGTFLSFAVFYTNRCCHVSRLLGSICAPSATCSGVPDSRVNCPWIHIPQPPDPRVLCRSITILTTYRFRMSISVFWVSIPFNPMPISKLIDKRFWKISNYL